MLSKAVEHRIILSQSSSSSSLSPLFVCFYHFHFQFHLLALALLHSICESVFLDITDFFTNPTSTCVLTCMSNRCPSVSEVLPHSSQKLSATLCLLYKLAFEGKIPLYYNLSKQIFRFYFVPTSPIPDSTNSPYLRHLSFPLTSTAFFLHSQFVNTSNRELSI